MSLPVPRDVNIIVQAVEEALGIQGPLRKLSAQKRRTFALDLSLIALACRCAWLVDVVAPQDPEQTYADLLRLLQQKHCVFADVQHVYLEGPDQSFFVNRALVSGSAMDAVSYVLLPIGQNKDPQLLPRTPPDVLASWHDLSMALRVPAPSNPTDSESDNANTFPNSVRLPGAMEPRTAIPLAAVLLGYGVAYVPEGSDAFLAQMLLDVYTCVVCAPGSVWKHTLLKFSCPTALAAANPTLAPAHIVAQLTARFEPRAMELGLTMGVSHSAVLMDRVAL
ncbi:hypothetical protein C8R43DRAFT_204182 [Mycena crocata]|nr:hypothetical protein C8R43DRAFT_204182 [Mycena crocata]